MSKTLLLIDGNNLAHRAYHKHKNLRSNKGDKTSIIFGFPYILRSLIHKFTPHKVVVVFDGGRSKKRLELLPTYKKREPKEDFDYEDFISQKEVLKKFLDCLGIEHTSKRYVEADDIIWLYARKWKTKGNVVIVSTDKDFNQLISPKVSVWNPWKNTRINHKNVKKIYDYEPYECVDWLCLDGDKSDNIPGLKGMGPKTIRKFLDQEGSILKYIKSDKDFSANFSRKLMEETWLLNRQLVDIRLFCRRNLKLKIKINTKPKKINTKELSFLCAKYSIKLFTEKNFLKTFKSN